eukprot:15366742-Ditylum_brightwellii.AAC.1
MQAAMHPSQQVNTSQPKQSVLTRDELLHAIGFLKPDKLIKQFLTLALDTVCLQHLERLPQLHPGKVASLKAPPRTKKLPTPLKHFGKVLHCDIGFGPVQAHWGIRYTLLFVDKATRKSYVYSIKSLKKKEILNTIRELIINMGQAPCMIRTDFEPKIISGKVNQFLCSKKIPIQVAFPKRQDQN